MHLALLLSLGAAVVANAAKSRNILYFDQWHTTDLPPQELTGAVTHVMMSFANSSLFATQPAGEYEPFQSLKQVRKLFDHKLNVCLSIGGWGDNSGFDEGVKTSSSRERFAKNIASTVDYHGFDCVDIDWEYPGGNGVDYKQVPNCKKRNEIKAYPLLLKEIKKAIGKKELSIAVPGLERDMIAYTSSETPRINESVDFVNVMTYDLMNRRDHHTTHHVSIEGAASAIKKYISLGFPASKLVVGIPFYAKWFTTKNGYTCNQPIGCPTELLEDDDDGSDTGKSGSMTFEAANFAERPAKLTTTPDNTCGAGTSFKCAEGSCCGGSGWCGSTPAHCGTGCHFAYGKCDGIDISSSFHQALKNGYTDEEKGAQWYWDAKTRIFWSWETPELIQKKISFLADTYDIKSVMAWALAQDSNDWSHLKAMQKGFVGVNT
ncbi:Chitinase 1 [Fusarium oxysporum f. sp. rapae]|uniref:Chitinase 1 n=1 Tax=Fusarium oxysporum f. sp. rapae TaxID=485398 RepID=A0A8J5NGQ6_FUSOX|nr:Chitinase 1 [Fusarium oxysporum f. sp. rapae]